jgi:hypothetical protein
MLKNSKIPKFQNLIILLIMGLFILACSEQKESPVPENEFYLKNSLSTYGSVSYNNGMLVFTDTTHFKSVMLQLENEYEAWNDQFEATWGYLSGDLYDQKAEQLSFDEEKPLKNFVKLFGLTPLKSKINTEQDVWLTNNVLDMNTYPLKDFGTSDPVIASMLNQQGEVKIGSTYYHITEGGKGNWVEIRNNDINALTKVRNKQPLADSSIVTLEKRYSNSDDGQFCDTRVSRDSLQVYENGDKRFTYMIGVRRTLWWTITKAEIHSFKKKNRGGWKGFKTDLKLQLEGNLYDFDCQSPTYFQTGTKEKKRKNLVLKHTSGGGLFKTQQGEIASYNYCNGQSLTFFLFWP